MIPFDTILLFLGASIALALAPGPDNIFVLTQSALYGRLAGFCVTLGLCSGLLVHTTAVALGVAAIFQTSAFAFNALKIAGALYLLYLAWGAFRAGAEEISPEKGERKSLRALYLRGVVMNITNPKVGIFFLAFLPQFASPANGSITVQIILLGALFALSTIVVFGSIAWAAGFLSVWLQKSDRGQIIMNRVAGVVFVGLALKLVTTQR